VGSIGSSDGSVGSSDESPAGSDCDFASNWSMCGASVNPAKLLASARLAVHPAAKPGPEQAPQQAAAGLARLEEEGPDPGQQTCDHHDLDSNSALVRPLTSAVLISPVR
jgi:hypothetical protein